MDSYAEQIVKKSDGGSDNLKRTLCLAGGVVLGIILVFIFMRLHLTLVGSILGVGAFYLGLYLGTNFDVEYEYLIVNGEFDIDKIFAKKRRKKMITVKVAEFDEFGAYDDNMSEKDDVTTIWAVGTGADCEKVFFGDFTHPSYGKCRLLFSPSVRVLRELKKDLKPGLKSKVGELPPEEEY